MTVSSLSSVYPLSGGHDIVPEGRKGIGIVDIGSNSVRLVVYDVSAAYPAPIFNENILCGLGNLDPMTGNLDPQATARTLRTVRRFMVLAERSDLVGIVPFATAAIRDAADGDEFAETLSREFGSTVRILTGDEEAYYTGLGVLSGIPAADGIVGDLGGGSLELVRISDGQVGKGISLPLGPLRLQALDDGTESGIRLIEHTIDRELAKARFLSKSQARPFYLVGGNWRAFARAHLGQMNTSHPVEVLHNYEIGHDEARGFAAFLANLSQRTIVDIEAISRRRADTLSLASRVLGKVLARMPGSPLVTSAYGVREGVLNDELQFSDAYEQPMLRAARNAEERRGRHPGFGDAVYEWSRDLFSGDESRFGAVRHLACLTSDLGWRHHPDHRAQIAALEALNVPWPGLTHLERALLCQIIAHRYTAKGHGQLVEATLRLLSDDECQWVERVGLTLRLAYLVSGGIADVLLETSIVKDKETLIFKVPYKDQVLIGEAVEKRFNVLARAFDVKPEIKIKG